MRIKVKGFARVNFVGQKLSGFTLIELLVVLSIIGVVMGIALVALGGTRAQGRDARRRLDLEKIRSGLEFYKTDCKKYPTNISFGGALTGDGSSSSCATSNTYIALIDKDPQDPTRTYRYSGTTTTYELCAALEQGSGTVTCGGSSSCGSTCNFKLTNP